MTTDTCLDPSPWHQINICFSTPPAGETALVTNFGPTLDTAYASGAITNWFFIRKPWWKLRYLPADPAVDDILDDAITDARKTGHINQAVHGIYEPETHAFGGEQAMAVAHQLFHADSHHIITNFGAQGDAALNPSSRRRELSLLLTTSMIRAAGLDHYELGDIWDKVSRHRPSAASTQLRPKLVSAVRRLITVDTTRSSTLRTGSLARIDSWLAAFEIAGRRLGELATEGQLTRGLRAVIAHHILFHWNRIGLTASTQSILAAAATEAVFGEAPSTEHPSGAPEQNRRCSA